MKNSSNPFICTTYWDHCFGSQGSRDQPEFIGFFSRTNNDKKKILWDRRYYVFIFNIFYLLSIPSKCTQNKDTKIQWTRLKSSCVVWKQNQSKLHHIRDGWKWLANLNVFLTKSQCHILPIHPDTVIRNNFKSAL